VTRPKQGLSLLAPGGSKIRDPGNKVDVQLIFTEGLIACIASVSVRFGSKELQCEKWSE